MLTVYASQPHYIDHLAPIISELERRGREVRLLVTSEALEARARRRGVLGTVDLGVPRSPTGGDVLVAGYRDARDTHSGRRLALLEHGAGQTYADVDHMGYPGGSEWADRNLGLVLVPGPHAAQGWSRLAGPRVAQVGCPKLDAMLTRRRGPTATVESGRRVVRSLPTLPRDPAFPPGRPTVAVTFHWPCRQSVETWPAWEDWRTQLCGPVARDPRWSLLGHWHPRWARGTLPAWWQRAGVATEADPDRVLEVADLLVADNTSLMYEAAALGIRVLGLRESRWRRDLEHGLRFWSHVPGLDLEVGESLVDAIAWSLDPQDRAGLERERAVAEVYGDTLDGRASTRAADELERWVDGGV